MSPVRTLAVLLITALAVGKAQSTEPSNDLAELFPPDVIVYVEVTQVSSLAKEIKTLFKGTALEDFAKQMDQAREEHPVYYPGQSPFSILGTILSPKELAEADRFEGAALAVIPFPKDRWEWVFILRPGQSKLPGLALKKRLANDDVKQVATIDEVPIHQEERNDDYLRGHFLGGINPPGVGGEAAAKPDPKKIRALTCAQVPGTLIFGNSQRSVITVLNRALKKKDHPTLGSTRLFPDRAARHRLPGLFVHLDARALWDYYYEGIIDPNTALAPTGWELTRNVVAPQTIQAISGTIGIHDGNLAIDLQANLDPKFASLLAQWCAGTRVNATRPIPSSPDVRWMMSFTLPAQDRAKKLLALADACVRATGTLGIHPSEVVDELNREGGRDVRASVLDRINAVSLVMSATQKVPEKAIAVPALVIQTDEESAKLLEQLIPRIVTIITQNRPDPIRETINGQLIHSLPASEKIWNAPIRFGQCKGVLVVGQDADFVARLLKESTSGQPTLQDNAAIHAVWKWSEHLPALMRSTYRTNPNVSYPHYGGFGGFGGGLMPIGGAIRIWDSPYPVMPGQTKLPEKWQPTKIKLIREVIQEMPPLEINVAQEGGTLHFLATQRQLYSSTAALPPEESPGSKSVLRKLINGWAEWIKLLTKDNPNGGIYPHLLLDQ